ncbi:unnamed protein product, partial [Tilletia laevis]
MKPPIPDTIAPFSNPVSSLSIISLNCGAGGLRARLFELSHESSRFLASAAIVCLQECHLPAPVDCDDTKALQDALRVSVTPPFRAILGRDTGILLRDPNLRIDSFAHGDHWTHVRLSSPDPICGTAHSTPTLIGADWNSVPDPNLDSLNGDPTSIPWRAPAAAIAPTHAVDVFRVLRPDSFSWTFASPTSARRLDSVWASPELLPHVASTDVASCRSDHRAVRVTFLQAPSPGAPAAPLSDGHLAPHRPWSLHPGLWNDPVFTRELSAFASFYNPPPLAAPSAINDWALYHGALFTFLQPLARSVSATQQRARSNLDHVKRYLDGLDLRDPTDATRLPSLLRQWRFSCSAVASSASLRPGGNSSASALREVSTASPSPLLYAIQLRLDHTAARTANSPFTLQEVHRALRTANRHSSSGPDGIPYRVYLATFESSGPLLQALANTLGDGPQWPVTARTILLPKSGDPANISNYRP